MSGYSTVPKDEKESAYIVALPQEHSSEEAHPKSRWATPTSLLTGAGVITFVIFINFLFTIYAGVHFGVEHGRSVLYRGSCAKTGQLSTWSHIVINILGTLALSASNNAQQYLAAPTRADVDRAHSKHDWLDIGIPSVHNLFKSRIGKSRRILWWLLALSSIPLHWVYNSALYQSVSALEYSVLFVSEDFVTSPDQLGFLDPLQSLYNDLDFRATNTSINNLRHALPQFERLSPSDCLAAYVVQTVSSRRDLVVVTNRPNFDVIYQDPKNDTILWYASPNVTNSVLGVYSSAYGNWIYGHSSYYWICPFLTNCDDTAAVLSLTKWTEQKFEVNYCLSERVPERCTFEMSISIMIVVIIFNAVKIACLGVLLFKSYPAPLATVGDAIASFMTEKDQHTTGMSSLSKAAFRDKSRWISRVEPYQPTSNRYYSAASVRRWIFCHFLYIAGLGTIGGLLGLAISSIVAVGLVPWDTMKADGFGHLINRNILTFTSTFAGSVLLANLPQLILSGIYLTYNGLATAMSATREYSSYSIVHQRGKGGLSGIKSLRVSDPKPGSLQRKAYYLQLPIRFIVPLLLTSAILHWFTSQSFFLAKTSIYSTQNAHTSSETLVYEPAASIVSCAFSTLPMLGALILGTLLVLVLNLFALLKNNSGMPNAGSCSAVMSAACHGQGYAEGQVSWGGSHDVTVDGHRRLGFVDGAAEQPVPGETYE